MIIDSDYLQHFGTRGMRWGVRKSKAKTGISRHHGALIDNNLRTINRQNKVIDSPFANKFVKDKLAKSGHKMLKQNARLLSGKAFVRDRLTANLLVGTHPAELIISRTPR